MDEYVAVILQSIQMIVMGLQGFVLAWSVLNGATQDQLHAGNISWVCEGGQANKILTINKNSQCNV